ncbi:DNA-binding transcriptional regulator of glucitol operon [Prauserella isguenensis]|uniref:DNA-binding transcriptional regulator of glucitol operon n=1 Tax=Prauserella isguenensis TaxID=1470180 RepID=A0A839S3J8_9PSEU|nr:DNA-binding transcriptional regulator of glucitol operon [Prauserella isguenensis]
MNPRSITGRAVGIAVLCVAAMVVCFGLAWWQWDRFSSAGGTFQNLGYVLQWPLFGLFPAFMVWRWRVLSRRRAEEAAGESGAESGGTAAAETGGQAAAPGTRARESARSRSPRPIRPAGGAPEDAADSEDPADAELAAYNRYLAELNARDQEVK